MICDIRTDKLVVEGAGTPAIICQCYSCYCDCLPEDRFVFRMDDRIWLRQDMRIYPLP